MDFGVRFPGRGVKHWNDLPFELIVQEKRSPAGRIIAADLGWS